MTKVWGPMGWMTLHSISICYPEDPTFEDKQVLNQFMTAFGNSITCIHCRTHFAQMFNDYKSKVPSWSNSKKDLFLAICRMHNAVNKRLDKPRPKTILECISSLKNATLYTSSRTFREKYCNYLIGDWSRVRYSGDGMTGYMNAFIVKKINDEYWNNRETSYDSISFQEDNVLDYSGTYKSQTPAVPKFSLSSLLKIRR